MNRRAMHLKTVAAIVAVLAAGMVFGQGVDPKALAEAQKAAQQKQLEEARAVFQDQLRRTETRGTITGRFAITQPAGSHFRASIEVRASDGRVEVDRVAFGEAGGWTHTEKTAEFKVQNVPVRPGVKYWIVVRGATCPLTHVFKPTPKSDVPGYWVPQECKSTPLMGKGTDLSRIPVTFNKDNTSDVGEIAVEPGGAATAPATRAAAGVDPRTASLADALTDWIALLEKDDVDVAVNRWVRDAPACHKMTTNWKALRECHKQHDYRRWIENSSDESTTRLVPGGAKQIGKDTTFRVGGHSFGHLHIMWEKTHSGWRIARVLECN